MSISDVTLSGAFHLAPLKNKIILIGVVFLILYTKNYISVFLYMKEFPMRRAFGWATLGASLVFVGGAVLLITGSGWLAIVGGVIGIFFFVGLAS
ncbi:MAG: hypothetical protein A2538_01565 [Candidatus Magasanikbacteria bacterium RIFOXYD2_FULL_41_14]|uniref:Uncharacterized protein n=1 Tax=Candidatus Magasanikbacteria bacterium RIFOXYD2_FULL_41_14 TaxID=1798709 RepID=A0A1F6PDR8_9BACT|nr:MAG: hypothetical protein A2538_01565 [Candidatus Magasanikbacteria bacterium RIFOXYD2_FULL_41_14]